jgi:hypothetical protein
MPARILVVTGRSAGAEHWVEEVVSRIGSDPGCNLTIPGIAPHALTLQYQGGGYRIFNRTSQPIELEGKSYKPAETADWKNGQSLSIGRQVTLCLQTAADPAPAPRPRQEVDGAGASADVLFASAAEDPARKKQRLLSGAVIAAVVLVLAVRLLGGSPASAQRSPSHEFDDLMKTVIWKFPENDLQLAAVRRNLQSGRVSELRGRYAEGVEQYALIRDLLLARRQSDGRFANDAEADVYSFVKSRLAALNGRK